MTTHSTRLRTHLRWRQAIVPMLIVLALVASACVAPVAPAAPGAEEAAEGEVVELTFRQSDPPNQVGDLFERALDEFMAQNPNIQVNFEIVPWADAQQQYVREVQAGGGPDVAQMAFVWTRDLAMENLVTNLDTYIEQAPPGTVTDMASFQEDFLGWDLGEYEGSIWGIPFSVDTFAMGYRPDLFEAAGVEEFPDNWDELFLAAQALTVDLDGDARTDQYGFCFPAGSGATSGMWFLANYYLWSNGHWFIQEADGGGFEVGATPEDIAGAMEYFNNFFETGVTPESMIAIDSWGDPEYTSALGRGDCAILFLPPSAFQAARDQSEVPLASAPDPQGSVTRISHLGGRTLVINPATEHPDEAWELLRFLTSQPFYEEFYVDYFPPQVSLLDNLVFEEAIQGYAEQLPHAVTFATYILSPAPVSAMWDATNREFGSVYSGQKTPDEAAADLADEMQNLLESSE